VLVLLLLMLLLSLIISAHTIRWASCECSRVRSVVLSFCLIRCELICTLTTRLAPTHQHTT
jgi:hypothetical protein